MCLGGRKVKSQTQPCIKATWEARASTEALGDHFVSTVPNERVKAGQKNRWLIAVFPAVCALRWPSYNESSSLQKRAQFEAKYKVNHDKFGDYDLISPN